MKNVKKTNEQRLASIEAKVDFNIMLVKYFFRKVIKIMSTIDEKLDVVLAGVAECDTKEDSLILLTKNLKVQLDAILASGGVKPETIAKVDEVLAKLSSNAAQVQAAIDENTPPSPEPE